MYMLYKQVSEPVVAYGPPGTSGEENVSVIVATSPQLASMKQLGDVESVGRKLLDTFAPPGSDRVSLCQFH